MKYLCPVCGYTELTQKPYDESGYPSYEVCPCCGFEFGFDDLSMHETYESYRKRWLDNGAVWFSETKKPNDFDLDAQLKNIDLG